MKTNQFLVLVGLLMAINSNVEDNYNMKVAFGVCSVYVFWAGVGLLVFEHLTAYITERQREKIS